MEELRLQVKALRALIERRGGRTNSSSDEEGVNLSVHSLELNGSPFNIEVADFDMHATVIDYDVLEPIYDEYPEEFEVVDAHLIQGEPLDVNRMTITVSKEGEDGRPDENLLDISRDITSSDNSRVKHVDSVFTTKTDSSKRNFSIELDEMLKRLKMEVDCLKSVVDDPILVASVRTEDADILSRSVETLGYKGLNEEFLFIIWRDCFPWHPDKKYFLEQEHEPVGRIKLNTFCSICQDVISFMCSSTTATMPYEEQEELDLRTSLFFQPEGNDGESSTMVQAIPAQMEGKGIEHYMGFASLLDHAIKTQNGVEGGKTCWRSECLSRGKTAKIQNSCIKLKLMYVPVHLAQKNMS